MAKIPADITLHDPVTALKGVGAAIALPLAKLDLHIVADLLFHLPRAYEDRSKVVPLAKLQVGQSALIRVRCLALDHKAFKSSLTVQVTDDTGVIHLRYFRVYAGLLNKFTVGKSLQIFGEVRFGYKGLEMYHPEVEILPETAALPKQALTPIYPLTEGLSQLKVRNLMQQALQLLPLLIDYLPALPTSMAASSYSLVDALRCIHSPALQEDAGALLAGGHPAQVRLALEELVAHQLMLRQKQKNNTQLTAMRFGRSEDLAPRLLASLPYTPTSAQQKVVAEIVQDLAKGIAMQRLVQGDVGSGKTLVAMLAACPVLEQQAQVAVLAPTELLAEQHYRVFYKYMSALGVEVVRLVSAMPAPAKRACLATIKQQKQLVIVGTHALLQDQVEFANLAMVVVDEQHRFGVAQRLALKNKVQPDLHLHQLVLSATPIPRTLALSLYSDLATSVLDELPPGRTPIATVVMPTTKKPMLIERLLKSCHEGRQVYWVCTLVEDNEDIEAQAAIVACEELQALMPNISIGLVHGKLKASEKQQVMQAFVANHIQLLVATTVVEVGVDVPNASIMVIENAERLGLSQLHQLRGRVGRGSVASACVLLYKPPISSRAQQRLAVIKSTNDGFAIAEADLKLRGPGEVLGTKQSGIIDFKIARLERDSAYLAVAHQMATQMLAHEQRFAGQPCPSQALVRRWFAQQNHYLGA